MKCKYCHKPAGFFSFKHKECEQKNIISINEIRNRLIKKLSESSFIEYDSFKYELSDTISFGYVSDNDLDKNVKDTLIDFFRNNNKTIDGINLKKFIFSLPEYLKNIIVKNDLYKIFWSDFLKLYYANIEFSNEKMDEYKNLILDLKSDNDTSNIIEKKLISVLESKILDFLSDGIINEDEKEYIYNFIEYSTLSNTDTLNESNVFQKFLQSLILRDIQEGKVVERCKIENLTILLSKNERVLWLFNYVEGYEEKTGSKYISGSRGISMKICKGVYYRVGETNGHSVEYEYDKELGKGSFIITNKNLYFIGPKQVKIGISKVLSFEPYSDGIVIVKDGVNPKPYKFRGFDPWFVINAMQLLAE